MPWLNSVDWHVKYFTFNGKNIWNFYTSLVFIYFPDGRIKVKCTQISQTEMFENVWVNTA